MKNGAPKGPNPYLNRSTIRDLDSFYGRTRELRQTFARLDANSPQCVSIVGDRRVGKSSFLKFIQHERVRKKRLTRPDDFIFLFLDLQMLIDKTPDGFYEFLFRTFSSETDHAELVGSIPTDAKGFGQMASELSGRGLKLVLLLDEFDRITATESFGLDFFARLRALAGGYNVAYITSSIGELSELCHSEKIADSPFFNIFHSIRLADITKAEAKRLIARPSAAAGIPLEPYTDFIFGLAGRFPLFIQMACSALFDNFAEDTRRTTPNMDRVKSDFLREAKPHFEYIWDKGFDDSQKRICERIIRNERPAEDRQLEGLIEKGYVSTSRGKHDLFSPTFKEFVAKELARSQQATLTVHRSGMASGQKLGPFEIIERLGKGGMSTVYKAKRAETGEIIALKILEQHLIAEDINAVRRFKRAARAACKLDHRNIAKGYEVGQFERFHYFAMEYVEGASLHALLKRGEGFDEERALRMTRQAAEALAHAHEARVVHRDIKPGNIIVTHDDAVKIVDFGIAKSFGVEEPWKTRTGVAIGTPNYMSPEQGRGDRKIDARSDIYSLGATLYHVLTGDPPFSGASAFTVIKKHVEDRLPPPQERNPRLSDGVCRLIEKMMAKDKRDRYQTVAELLSHINTLLAGESPFSELDERTASVDATPTHNDDETPER